MPFSSFQLLVRPNPGGLDDHKRYIVGEAQEVLKKQKFSDLVFISEDGQIAHCNLSLVAPRSPLLRSMCGNTPQYPGSSSEIFINVPISGKILLTIQELLYSGQVSRSWKEIEQVSAGLALLGINDFSGNYHRPPVPQFSYSGITAIQCHPKSPEIPNQVLVQTAFQQQPPHVSTGLMIQKISQSLKCEKSETNNNDSPCRKKKIVDHQQHNASLEYKDEEIQLEGSPVTEEVNEDENNAENKSLSNSDNENGSIECEDCGMALRSEWHRHPSRHDCNVDSEGKVRCPDCHSQLRNSWYLPPSRHNCNKVSSYNERSNETDDEDRGKKGSKRNSRRSVVSPQFKQETPETSRGFITPSRKVCGDTPTNLKQFTCPLKGCERSCETKKLLMLHLALSHFIVKLEEKYITPEFIDGAGERLCPHCGQLQPPNKLSFIRHIAMEHEDIIEVFAADKMFGNK